MTGSEECGSKTANACIVRGGDPTVADDKNPRFSNGNVCQGQTASFQSKFGRPRPRARRTRTASSRPRSTTAARSTGAAARRRSTSRAQEEHDQDDGAGHARDAGGTWSSAGAAGWGTFIGSEIRIV
ncbi:hypothetical protein CSOJ01_02930 [Colletotrichum sojae]|uniref:Uncharacterized protein n=1 Tax=Colletotrichum sojae TaxID=2175907 RepID=A0A8H6JPY6_9PEZI|nr:hypothetical protein CSOJ01_02930 [Colletotrichum sojae]